MYGSQSDSGNWDHMLDGTMDSIMQMQEPEDELIQKTDNQLQTSSTITAASDDECRWLQAEREQINQQMTSMMATLDEMEWDSRKYRSSLEHYIHQIELLKSGTAQLLARLDSVQQAITHDPDMVTMGRSIDEGDQHVTNKSQYGRIAVRLEKRGDVDRDGGSLLLASFQGPDDDDGEILSRIDLLKKNAVVVSSGNRQEIVSRPLSAAAARGGADENRAKLLVLPQTRQVKLPETLEATSPLETDEG